MIQVAIIENDPAYLQAISQLIGTQSDMYLLIAKPSIAEFFLSLDLGQAPDILLLHPQGGTDMGLEHVEKINKLMPEVPIIILSGNESPKMIRKWLMLGVGGYYYKGESLTQLLNAIREINRGNGYLSPKASKIAMEMIRRPHEGMDAIPDSNKIATRLSWNASQRELTVIRGLMDGKSYKEIAASNFMTIDGVRYYIRSIYPKLGVSNRDQLVRILGR